MAEGTVSGATTGTLYVNGEPFPFTAVAGTFAVPLRLTEPETEVIACADGTGGEVCGDTLRWTLGYAPRPEAEVRPTVAGRTVTLEGHVLDNPDGAALTFTWAEDPGNPAALGLSVQDDSTATVTVPGDAPPGEYYFDWTVHADDGDAFAARTFVTVREDGSVTPFVLETDHAAWVDRAVVYEIFTRRWADQNTGTLDDVTQRLPELVRLGVNTIWLQPIYPYADAPIPSQGYDVTDYFSIWEELGTEEDLHELVAAAHEAGVRVLLDFVPNHTSIEHPYAQDAIAHGERSHYYDFYQREEDDAPYSQHYVTRQVGEMTFVTYFEWNEDYPMANLDYDNPEVQRLIVEATRYWVETFDVDGFRFDVGWGVASRNPAFVQAWRAALKRVKPGVFMLGEAKATDEVNFEGRYDAAYDWTTDPNYISEWAWQRGGQGSTIFNTTGEPLRASALRNALTDFGNGYHPDAVVFRYLENNDTPSFYGNHSVEQTKMAATLLFSLHGIPMMLYGQEVGVVRDLYEFPSFPTSRPISDYDHDGLFAHYQHLLLLRETFPALHSDHFEEVAVAPADVGDQTFAYRRWEGTDNVVAAINMGDDDVTAALALPVDDMGLDPETTYYLTDLFSGEALAGTGADLADFAVPVPAYTTRLFAVADSVVAVPTVGEPAAPSAPDGLALAPNYPNPFSGRTTLTYAVARGGPVRLAVFDLLGREVARLVDGVVPAGRQTATFDGAALASGVYLCRLESEGQVVTRRMALVR
ncbi:MAG TPA: alpha-amylase family glycosyl hydrolase [Rubricoccaceae bacterium]|nr:alpha-amylase family glycosyl hydrolase [Rubricoccaceae bacterium]